VAQGTTVSADVRIFVLAGGLGTRLRRVLGDVPKPMADVAGRPFLEWQIDGFHQQGFDRFVLLVGHRKEAVVGHLGDGARLGVRVEYSMEDEPLGTGGAFLKAVRQFPCRDFVLVNGDTYFMIPLQTLVQRAQQAPGTLWVASRLTADPARYGTLEVDRQGSVARFRAAAAGLSEGFINGGIYTGAAAVLDGTGPVRSFEADVLPGLAARGVLRTVAYGEPFIDIGVEEDYAVAQTSIPRWQSARKRKAIFLDRDGILVEDPGYIKEPAQVRLKRECLGFLKEARARDYLLIVVTNQGGVAKGKMSLDDVGRVNDHISTELRREGVVLDDILVCPHHPDGVVAEYSRQCLDRKPDPGMILRAAERWNLDLERSMLVGDKDSDVIVNTVLKSRLIEGKYPIQHREARTDYDELTRMLEPASKGNAR